METYFGFCEDDGEKMKKKEARKEVIDGRRFITYSPVLLTTQKYIGRHLWFHGSQISFSTRHPSHSSEGWKKSTLSQKENKQVSIHCIEEVAEREQSRQINHSFLIRALWLEIRGWGVYDRVASLSRRWDVRLFPIFAYHEVLECLH